PASGSGTGLNAPTTVVSGQARSLTLVSRWVGTTVASSPASTARSGSDGSARWSQVKWNTVDPHAVATSAISTVTGYHPTAPSSCARTTPGSPPRPSPPPPDPPPPPPAPARGPPPSPRRPAAPAPVPRPPRPAPPPPPPSPQGQAGGA